MTKVGLDPVATSSGRLASSVMSNPKPSAICAITANTWPREEFKTHAMALGQMLYGIAVNLFLTLPFILLAVVVARYALRTAFKEAVRRYRCLSAGEHEVRDVSDCWVAAGVCDFSAHYPESRTNAGPQWSETQDLFQLLRALVVRRTVCRAVSPTVMERPAARLIGLYYWLVLTNGTSSGRAAKAIEPRARDVRAALFAVQAAAALPFLAGILQFLAK